MSDANSKLLIRQAAGADIASILQLQKKWEQEDITYGYIVDKFSSIEAKLGPYFLVAEVDGSIVGFVSGSVSVSDGLAVVPSGESYLEVDDIYVDTPFCDQQIGGKLVDHILEVAKQSGHRKALVYSATKEVRRVLSFYENHGFKSWYIQMYNDL